MDHCRLSKKRSSSVSSLAIAVAASRMIHPGRVCVGAA
jgi:hypothetical protein